MYPKPLSSGVTKAENLIYIRQKSNQKVLVQRDPLQDIDAEEEEAVHVLFLVVLGCGLNPLELGFSKVWDCMHLLEVVKNAPKSLGHC
jgi:hypothetical protein